MRVEELRRYKAGDKVTLVKKEIRIGNFLVRAKANGIVTRVAELDEHTPVVHSFFVEFCISNHIFIGTMLYDGDFKPKTSKVKNDKG